MREVTADVDPLSVDCPKCRQKAGLRCWGKMRTNTGIAHGLIDPHPARTKAALALHAESEQRECRGHPAGTSDPMGETVYCDGSCRGAR